MLVKKVLTFIVTALIANVCLFGPANHLEAVDPNQLGNPQTIEQKIDQDRKIQQGRQTDDPYYIKATDDINFLQSQAIIDKINKINNDKSNQDAASVEQNRKLATDLELQYVQKYGEYKQYHDQNASVIGRFTGTAQDAINQETQMESLKKESAALAQSIANDRLSDQNKLNNAQKAFDDAINRKTALEDAINQLQSTQDYHDYNLYLKNVQLWKDAPANVRKSFHDNFTEMLSANGVKSSLRLEQDPAAKQKAMNVFNQVNNLKQVRSNTLEAINKAQKNLTAVQHEIHSSPQSGMDETKKQAVDQQIQALQHHPAYDISLPPAPPAPSSPEIGGHKVSVEFDQIQNTGDFYYQHDPNGIYQTFRAEYQQTFGKPFVPTGTAAPLPNPARASLPTKEKPMTTKAITPTTTPPKVESPALKSAIKEKEPSMREAMWHTKPSTTPPQDRIKQEHSKNINLEKQKKPSKDTKPEKTIQTTKDANLEKVMHPSKDAKSEKSTPTSKDTKLEKPPQTTNDTKLEKPVQPIKDTKLEKPQQPTKNEKAPNPLAMNVWAQ